jgi:hypothetical protein
VSACRAPWARLEPWRAVELTQAECAIRPEVRAITSARDVGRAQLPIARSARPLAVRRSGAKLELLRSRICELTPPRSSLQRQRLPANDAAGARAFGDRLAPAVAFATTEHFNLQTARAVTVSEANGRASIYMAAISSSLIALAFIGQVSRLGAAFYAFALIVLPVLAFMGIVTFQRLVQSSLEDMAYAQRIGRLRGFYVAVVPELAQYVLVVDGTRARAPMAGGGASAPSAWQLTLTTAGMVAVLNSVVLGACAGLLLQTLDVGPLATILAAGTVVGAVALYIQRRHHGRARDAYAPEAIDRMSIVVPPTPAAEAT